LVAILKFPGYYVPGANMEKTGKKKHFLKKVIDRVKKGLDKLLAPEEEIDLVAELVGAALAKKLSSYYNKSEPEIGNLEFTEEWKAGEFNLTAQVMNLQSSLDFHGSADVQDANLQAEVEISREINTFIPVTGIIGMETMNTNLAPVHNTVPVIHKIKLEITSSSKASGIAESGIRDIIAKKYPGSRLADKSVPLIILDPANFSKDGNLFCEKLIVDSDDPKKRNKEFFRLVKIIIKKIPVEKKIDECLTIEDCEYKIEEPRELGIIKFPDEKTILQILNAEKKSLQNKVLEFMGPGFRGPFRKLFFGIKKPFKKIELKENAADSVLTFGVEFVCTVGFSGTCTVSTEMSWRFEKSMILKYLEHTEFIPG